MDTLILIGMTVFMGTLGGKIFQRFKVPQVMGYIVTGLILGKSMFNVWNSELIASMDPLVNLALGIIGFMIGSELKFEVFRKLGRTIYTILFCEGLVTFLVVACLITLVTGKLYYGILLGAIASATAPAATVDVLWEYKTRGPLTSTLLAIVALDDVLALVLYAFCAIIARAMISHEHIAFFQVGFTFLEIISGLLLGIVGGVCLHWLINFIKDRERILPFSFGVIMLIVGITSYFKMDLILANMLAGLTLVNIAPVESREIFESIKKASTPIYILFFVLVGARLDVSLLFQSGLIILVLVYFLSRTVGKLSGSYLGGVLSKAPRQVTRYLGLGLFSQAGVAIGLAISMYQNLNHLGYEANQIGLTIINIIVASTFIVQMIGPPCVRLAAAKAGELWKDVTEEDILQSYKVSDFIEENVPIIREDTPLHTMVELIKSSDSDDFCVVDNQNRLLGSISLGDLRDILLEQKLELNQLVFAKDIAVPSTRVIADSRPVKDAVEILRRKDLDFLPVVKDEKTRELVGLIHYRSVMSEVQRKLLAKRGEVPAFGD